MSFIEFCESDNGERREIGGKRKLEEQSGIGAAIA